MKKLLLFFGIFAMIFIDFESLYFAISSNTYVEMILSIIVGLSITAAGVLALPLFSVDKTENFKKRYNY